jgi:hypothetical protein
VARASTSNPEAHTIDDRLEVARQGSAAEPIGSKCSQQAFVRGANLLSAGDRCPGTAAPVLGDEGPADTFQTPPRALDGRGCPYFPCGTSSAGNLLLSGADRQTPGLDQILHETIGEHAAAELPDDLVQLLRLTATDSGGNGLGAIPKRRCMGIDGAGITGGCVA